MQDLLSQDEIDALLHGVDDGDIDTYEETDDTGVKNYDLASQDRIVRGRMPTLEMINERFAAIPVSVCSTCCAAMPMSPPAVSRS